ncbi:tripartite tricarboxylate transporter TctB family protein [Thermoanaerobacterium sp. DL9XJH110]|uniref:tripartite tricarboxylate transporter TctB family protein n=1 Tax=Thermoanaerobacterium sp. DL9XJH110 TaxID=3386643 RepID=UPI003BB4F7A7
MNPNVIVGMVATIIGIIYSIQALSLPKATIGNPWAPVYFPLALGILMAALGVVMIAVEVLRGNTRLQAGAKAPKDKSYIILIIGTIIICVVYAAVFNIVGFIISTLFFLGGMLFLVNGSKAWLTNTVITVVFTFAVWYAFEKILMISLP